MNILFLGPEKDSQNRLVQYLGRNGEDIFRYEGKLSPIFSELSKYDFLISYGYRYIIREKVLRLFDNRAINLHISLLPWNRGADPNLWSILENTPAGVSIHQLDTGIDTGDILCQREVFFSLNDTLRSSYEKLGNSMEKIFENLWYDIKNNEISPSKQLEKGSFHKLKDKNPYIHLLVDGWDTKIKLIRGKALENA